MQTLGQNLSMLATVASGIVSAILILSAILDLLTSGRVRKEVRGWLGIEQLRRDHGTTQTFLVDLGDSYNELSHVVCDEHEIPPAERPPKVYTDAYERIMDDEDSYERGDFLRD